MSVLANPTVAWVVARGMQWGMGRAARRTSTRARSRFPGHRATTEPLRIPSTPGPVTATIYRPARTDRTPPVYVNLHGGGYVMGVREQDDPVCRLLAVEAGVVVVNVDYALAPQHRFPQPPEQIHEILVWIAEHGSEHGWDGTRLVVGGQSAGGALAAAGARLALERGGPAISLQVLHYPPLDLTVPAGAKHSPLARPMLRPWMGTVFDAAYVPDVTQRSDRLVSPAGGADEADLTGIAPALVIVAHNDILAEEGRRYARRLEAAGALRGLLEVPDADHGYDVDDDVKALSSCGWIAERVRVATAVEAPPLAEHR